MVIKKRLGELLVESQLLDENQLQHALKQQKQTGERLGRVLINQGYVTEQDIINVLEFQLGIPQVQLFEQHVAPEILQLVPETIVKRYKSVPWAKKGGKLTVAMLDPLNVLALDDLQLTTGLEIEPVIATEAEIDRFIGRYYGLQELANQVFQEMDVQVGQAELLDLTEIDSGEAPVVRIVNSMIQQAIKMKASDIHLEPSEDRIRVRFRIDGMLREVMKLPKGSLPSLVSRVKIMADMDIAEKRVPQDGRVQLKADGRQIDLRVSTIPTLAGEKIVARILDKAEALIKLDNLGFSESVLQKYRSMTQNTYGMVLVTGPTGSGKTTTLYATLNEINTPEKNIVTIEDPVEYILDEVNQVRVNVKAGLSFATGLRAILRQDPNVIMIGEIRDGETADIAVRAATTGHLVFSTLHTNDAAGALTRLIDMGVEPFLVASSVTGVLAQRLVRHICPNCREEYEPEPGSPEFLFAGEQKLSGQVLAKGSGCRECDYTGYQGRIAIQEVLPVSQKLRQLILVKAPSSDLRQAAVDSGMLTLKEDGIAKALQGITTISEVMRVAYIDES